MQGPGARGRAGGQAGRGLAWQGSGPGRAVDRPHRHPAPAGACSDCPPPPASPSPTLYHHNHHHQVYMSYIQATEGGGGWPMSCFLTPSLDPFFGGGCGRGCARVCA